MRNCNTLFSPVTFVGFLFYLLVWSLFCAARATCCSVSSVNLGYNRHKTKDWELKKERKKKKKKGKKQRKKQSYIGSFSSYFSSVLHTAWFCVYVWWFPNLTRQPDKLCGAIVPPLLTSARYHYSVVCLKLYNDISVHELHFWFIVILELSFSFLTCRERTARKSRKVCE